MLNEIWKEILEFPNYEVSNLGRIRNKKTGLIRKQHKGKTCIGYWNIMLWSKNKSKNCLVHRLVANAFIPNPLNKPQVNHIDGNRENNCVTNLEWVTVSENLKHSFRLGNKKARALGQKAYNSFYSNYHNVCWRKDKQRWTVTTKINNKRLTGKLFKSEVEAAKYADELLRLHNITDRPFNFP